MAQICCVALLGKENNPLFLRTFAGQRAASAATPAEHDSMFQLIVNAAIDHVETKVNAQRTAAQSMGGGGKLESYLGFLYPINGMRVYGYVTNTKLKFVAVLDDEEVKESDMRAFFRRVHSLYADTVANPFHTPDTELHACATFQRQIGRIVEAGLFPAGVRVGSGGV